MPRAWAEGPSSETGQEERPAPWACKCPRALCSSISGACHRAPEGAAACSYHTGPGPRYGDWHINTNVCGMVCGVCAILQHEPRQSKILQLEVLDVHMHVVVSRCALGVRRCQAGCRCGGLSFQSDDDPGEKPVRPSAPCIMPLQRNIAYQKDRSRT